MKKLALASTCVAGLGLGLWMLSAGESAQATAAAVPAAAQRTELVAPAVLIAEETSRAPADMGATAGTVAVAPEALSGFAEQAELGELLVRAVTEGSREPVSGEVVTVHFQEPGATSIERIFGSTGEDGTASFELPAGYVSVRLLRGRMDGALVESGKTTTLAMAILPGASVSGAVVDADGRPVPGAEIWVSERWSTNRGYALARTDARGRFQVEDLRNWHWIGASAAGFAPSDVQQIRAVAGDQAEVRIVLSERGGTGRGLVLGTGGAPLAGARVMIGSEVRDWERRAASGAAGPGGPPLYLVSDAEGRFSSERVPEGAVEVQVRAAGHGLYRSRHVLVGAGEVVIALAAEAAVAGRVTDGEGQPIAGAAIRTPNQELFGSATTSSDRDGRFHLGGLWRGEVLLEAFTQEQGSATIELSVAPGRTSRWDPVLVRAETLSGRLIDGPGAPVADWHVSAFPEGGIPDGALTAVTDEQGGFVLHGAGSVPYTLWLFERHGHGKFPGLIHHGALASADELLLRLGDASLERGTVVGEVLGPEGRPVPNVSLTVWHHEQRIWREYPVDGRSGRVEVPGVPPGTISCELRPDAYPWLSLGQREVQAGETLDLGTHVLAHPGGIQGRISGLSDEHLERLQMVVGSAHGGEAGVIQRKGREFHSGPLGAGSFYLVLRGEFIAQRTIDFQLEASEVRSLDVVLEPAGKRSVHLLVPAGSPAPVWAWGHAIGADGEVAWQWAGSDELPGESAGLIARVSAPPGTYQLYFETRAGLVARGEVAIPDLSGGHPPIELALRPE